LQPAAEALREAIRLQPDFAGAHTNLGAVLRQLGDADGAAAESRKGLELLKQKSSEQAAAFATNSGRKLLSAGDIDGAISQFRAAIQAQPLYALAHYQLGLALQRKGNKEEALKEFQKAAAIDPHLKAPGT